MVLNYIWAGFFIVAFLLAAVSALFSGEAEVFSKMVTATFDYAKMGFEISLGLTSVLCLWMGIMKIGEKAGVINVLARAGAPIFGKLFPEIPKNDPVTGAMFMNFSANLLGLDNAATPVGLDVMKRLQEMNPDKASASNSMIMFLMINASGLTLFPITIMMYRAQMGAANPADVFVPIMIATGMSTLTAIIMCSIKQKINLLQKEILIPAISFIAFLVGLTYLFVTGDKDKLSAASTVVSNFLLILVIIAFLLTGLFKKNNVYEDFIEGAKGGFSTAITIIPYLVAILVAIGVFRASGAMDYLMTGLSAVFKFIGINTDFIEAIPTMIMKPLSGSGSRGLMLDAMNAYGVDSFVGRVASVVQGSTDTTFYVVALYYGSIAVNKIRYTLTYSLCADLVGMITAVLIAYVFWG